MLEALKVFSVSLKAAQVAQLHCLYFPPAAVIILAKTIFAVVA